MHLTAMEIFTTACSYISQTVEDSEDIIGFAPAWLNVLLAECLETENTLRRMDGQAELEEAPRVSGETMSMEIPYHEALTRIALPYGLASDASPSRSRNITELAVSKSRRAMDKQIEIPSSNSTWSCLRNRHRSARNRYGTAFTTA